MRNSTVSLLLLIATALPAVAASKAPGAREQFAQAYAMTLLNGGIDAQVVVENSALSIRYEPANEALAQRLRVEFVSPRRNQLKKLGFQSVVLRDGFGYEHRWNLEKFSKQK